MRGGWGVNLADADDVVVKNIVSTIKAHGMKVVGIATPVFKCDLPNVIVAGSESSTGMMHGAQTHGFKDQIEILHRCIEAAVALDTKLIRVFTFWKKTELTPAIEDAIVEAFREPARIAEAAGITLLVENEHACFTGTGVETARVLARINSPAVRSVWDPGNAQMALEVPFPVGYNAIKEYIAHVHIKDVDKNQQWTVVGAGVIDWKGQLAALKADGYNGYLSLETHYSGGGDPETSSRQCLAGLKKLFETISA